jgi:hypothetical protein
MILLSCWCRILRDLSGVAAICVLRSSKEHSGIVSAYEVIRRPGFAPSLCIVEIVGLRIGILQWCWLHWWLVRCFTGGGVAWSQVMSMLLPCRADSWFRILISPVMFLGLGRNDKNEPPFVSCPKYPRCTSLGGAGCEKLFES